MNNSAGRELPGTLGIDAGGTFTDLAFLCGEPLRVQAQVKTPTKHGNLIATIENGLEQMLKRIASERIRAVNLATTLATNAIVENKLRSAGLILIGYDAEQAAGAMREGKFATDFVRMVAGGHDARGNEMCPLDEKALEQALDELGSQVEAIAISGYFSVRNTAHERRAREIAQHRLPNLHITCGHELASDLDANKRATTAALNAGLIPIVIDLLRSVKQVCDQRGINAPLTVMRGDGSLVSAEWAQLHPIEMVLSGPAASACGAYFLAGADTMSRASWAVDIGGTTTDIIHLQSNGKPAITDQGATVGGHCTLVKAIDIYTFGLGGDSRVRYNLERKLSVGPRRVRPLCAAAQEYPQIVDYLQYLLTLGKSCEPLIAFPGRNPQAGTAFEQRILHTLSAGPQMVEDLLKGEQMNNIYRLKLEDMEARGLIEFAAFTPTDALHILDLLDKWHVEASWLGAKLLAIDGQEPQQLATAVREAVVRQIAFQLFRKSFSRYGYQLAPDGEGERIIKFALDGAVADKPSIALDLNAALIGVGAPSWAFIDQVGRQINQPPVLPEHAGVAGAVGAACGVFSLNHVVLITPSDSGIFRVHHPLGIMDCDDLEQAVTAAHDSMLPWLTERAYKAGAKSPKITFIRKDEQAWIRGGSHKMYLWTELFFSVED